MKIHQKSYISFFAKSTICFIVLFALCTNLFAKAKGVVAAAQNKGDITEAVSYLQDTIPTITDSAEKKEAHIFLGKLLQQRGDFMNAYEAYSQAIALDTTNPNVDTRLNAAICALSAGEISIAEYILDSVLKINSTDESGAKAKFYAVWCGVLKAETENQLDVPIQHLENFLEDKSMKSLNSAILFSLWWLTSNEEYKTELVENYPSSPEAWVASGKSSLLPLPYWYFILRRGENVKFQIPSDLEQEEIEPTVENVVTSNATSETFSLSEEKIVWQQVGLFRNEENAQRLVAKLANAGFEAEILIQTKTSGNKYTAVVVKETDGTIGNQLRNAGFECYPVFE